MKGLIKKMLFLFTKKETEQDYIDNLREKGIKIGHNTVFFDWRSNIVDTQRPWLIEIGNYCKITHGVVILSHDYSRSVLRRVYGEVIDGAKRTIIGDNVFIGMNSVILMGANIGNNVIIGAGSIVSGTVPDNVVVAGNPAKIICTLDEYYQKRKSLYVEEAKENLMCFKEHNGRIPTINEMGAFFPIYLERSRDELKKHNIRTNLSGDEEEDVVSSFLQSKPVYESYQDFVDDALK